MTDLVETLEKLVDSQQNGLLHVINALDLMCAEKADHIEINWQDKTLAREWRRASNALYTAMKAIEPLSI